LDHLDKGDRIGIAHWCDDGNSELDLLPTADRDRAISTLAQILQPVKFVFASKQQSRHGELACQQMIRAILQNARDENPQPLPIIMFLHSDWTGMPRDELDGLVTDVLETSGIVFGIEDQSVPEMGPSTYEQGAIFYYLASETGEQYLSAKPELYSTALEEILLQLHFRYQLGFVPPALDGKRHKLTVKLTKDGKNGTSPSRFVAVRST
jgi:hypothetical protein